MLSVLPALAAADGASEFEAQLLRLADRALEAGDLQTAGQRYERVVSANPGSAAGHAGLGAVAQRREQHEQARKHFEAAIAIEPAARAARFGLATLAERDGRPAAAGRHLEAVLVASPFDPVAHARLAQLTGPAPAAATDDPEEIRRRAARHPYDPSAQIAVARLFLAEGDPASARRVLGLALGMADLRPTHAEAAFRMLAPLEGTRRMVPVYVYADESVRSQEGWAFELRFAWSRASQALASLLKTRFVPISFSAFESAKTTDALEAIHGSLRATPRPIPQNGIIAAFTRRPAPRTATANRLGQAHYLGREMIVRIDPEEEEPRTLAHEILHLYGAMHVADAIPSLMNPSSGEWTLDPFNARVLAVTASRRFGRGSVEQNVYAHIDESALADALMAGLEANVRIRRIGIQAAHEEAKQSRFSARVKLLEAIGQDRQLGDVAHRIATLKLRNDQPAEAVALMESAARLYGPRTARGQRAQAQADHWRRAYKALAR